MEMLRGIYSVIYGEINVSVCIEIKGIILKNNKFVFFLSPEKVGQAGNFWTHPRIFSFKGSKFNIGIFTLLCIIKSVNKSFPSLLQL